MGYLVLGIENLAAVLVLAALVTACVARVSGKWRRSVYGLPFLLLMLAPYLLVTFATGALEFGDRLHTGWFWPLLLLSLGCLVGSTEIWRRGLRLDSVTGRRPAATWPRAKLVVALAAIAVLHAMTFGNLDAGVKQSLAMVRTEAAALASSVAPMRLLDRENAALIYQQVFEGLPAETAWPTVWYEATDDAYFPWHEVDQRGAAGENADAAVETPFDFKSPELAELLQRFAGDLALLRKAAATPGCYFDHNYGNPSWTIMLPEMSQLRQASRLLTAHARWSAAQGDLKSALADIAAMYRMAQHAATEPMLIPMLVGVAIDQHASSTLEIVLRSAQATQEDLADMQIDDLISYQRLASRALRMEQAFSLNTFADLDSMDPATLVELIVNPPQLVVPYFGPFYRVFLLADDLAAYRKFLRDYEQSTSGSYQANHRKWQAIDERLVNEKAGLLTLILAPSLSGALEAAVRADARHRVAQVGLAMYRYRAAHGKFADKLDDLTPDWMPLVPRDPYDGQPLKLRTTEIGWVVYSIGPDLKDDQGEWINWSTGNGDLAFECVQTPQSMHK